MKDRLDQKLGHVNKHDQSTGKSFIGNSDFFDEAKRGFTLRSFSEGGHIENRVFGLQFLSLRRVFFVVKTDNRGHLVGIDWSSTFDLSLSQAEGGGSKYEKIRRNEG